MRGWIFAGSLLMNIAVSLPANATWDNCVQTSGWESCRPSQLTAECEAYILSMDPNANLANFVSSYSECTPMTEQYYSCDDTPVRRYTTNYMSCDNQDCGWRAGDLPRQYAQCHGSTPELCTCLGSNDHCIDSNGGTTYTTVDAGCPACKQQECNEGSFACVDRKEICGNGVDDNDCDTLADCADPDCSDAGPGGPIEICGDGVQNDCNPNTDDSLAGGANPYTCYTPQSVPAPAADDPRPENSTPQDCDESCGKCDGAPVDLLTRQMFVGPHSDAVIESGFGESWDLRFERIYDSKLARRDFLDDTRVSATTKQHPYSRVLGVGMRHSYGDRLYMEGGTTTNPNSVLWESLRGNIRLNKTGTTTYGRAAGSNVHLDRLTVSTPSGTRRQWTLRTDDGDVLVFYDNGGVGTELHRWGTDPADATVPASYQARLKYIYPANVPSYRINVWHEQDWDLPSAGSPATSRCAEIVPGATSCTASRGLLVAVGAQYYDGVAWQPGSSLEFKYAEDLAAGGPARNQYILAYIYEGADRADNVASADITRFARYLYSASANAYKLIDARDQRGCNQWPSGSSDRSLCSSANASERYKYSWNTTAGLEWALSMVQMPVQKAGQSPGFAPAETHGWVLTNGKGYVANHESPGVNLDSLSSATGTGPKRWIRNGETHTTTFDGAGMPLNCESGACGHPTRQKDYQYSALFPSQVLGVSRQPNKDGTWTLRRYTEQGEPEFEAVVVPSPSSAVPALAISSTGSYDELILTNTAAVRKARRYYYTYYTTNSFRRAFAVAELASFVTGAPRFPAGDVVTLANLKWYYSGIATNRPMPQFKATLGVDYYYNLSISDADDSDDDLNEQFDKQVVWTHRIASRKTSPTTFTYDYDSTWVEPDVFGRAEREWTYACRACAVSTAAITTVATLMGKSQREYYALSGTAERVRGREFRFTRYGDPGTSTLPYVEWEGCDIGDGVGPFNEDGSFHCRVTPQGSQSLYTTQTFSVLASPYVRQVRSASRTGTLGATILHESYVQFLAGGFVVERGTVGGNATRLRATATSGVPASWARAVAEETDVDSSGTALVTRTTAYSPDGFPTERRQYAGTTAGALRRKSTLWGLDGNGRPGIANQYHSIAAGAFTKTYTTYDPITKNVATVTEPDGTVVTNVYGTSGNEFGRLQQVKRGGTVVASYEYDLDGRVKRARREALGSSGVAEYAYDESGRLERETMFAANGTVRVHREDIAVYGGIPHRVQETLTQDLFGATLRHIETYFDPLGRVAMICDVLADPTCVSPVVDYFYDTKPVTGAKWVEARTITLSNENTKGRLSYVIHPAGVTFYEYDVLGRPKTVVTHSAPITTALGTTVSQATEYTYTATGEVATMRYPSGRRLTNTWGADKRQPTQIQMTANADGVTTPWTIVALGSGALDVDGFPTAFNYFSSTSSHNRAVTRDDLGRIKELKETVSGIERSRVTYDAYEADGDLTQETDRSASHSWTDRSTASQSAAPINYTYEAYSDRLSGWKDRRSSTAASVTYGPAGLRATHSVAGVAGSPWNYFQWTDFGNNSGEEGLEWTSLTGGLTNSDRSVGVSYNAIGEMTEIDYGHTAGVDIKLGYGPRGNVVSTETSLGVSSQAYDHQMLRWKVQRALSTSHTRFTYGAGGELLDERDTIAGTLTRNEYVYLAGRPVAMVLSTSGQYLVLTFTDRMGVIRKTTRVSGTSAGASVARTVMDPWGAAGDRVNDDCSLTVRCPTMQRRYPGQYQDTETGLIENRWRWMLPDWGMYTAPDPEHRASATSFHGPQAYVYASGRPLSYVDPLGRSNRDIYRIIHWGYEGIATMTALGLRNPNPYWNNISNVFVPEGPEEYLECRGQATWMQGYLNRRNTREPLEHNTWNYIVQTWETVGGLGHAWVCAKNNQDDCQGSRPKEEVLVDPWYGVATRVAAPTCEQGLGLTPLAAPAFF